MHAASIPPADGDQDALSADDAREPTANAEDR